MRVAICGSDENEIGRIRFLLENCSALAREKASVEAYRSEDDFWEAFRPGVFGGVVVGYGDVEGFLFARRLREEDEGCRVIFLDDTDRYAIRGMRIHLSDYLVRPFEDSRLRAALLRMLAE